MRSIAKAAAFLGAVALAGGMAACGSSPSSGSSASAGASRTVTDTTGRTVRIPANVTRVATNLPLIPPMMAAEGGSGKLVYQPSGDTTPLMTKADPALAKVASAPVTSMNAESLLKTRPQVFIMTSLTAGMRSQVTRLGIPVVEVATPSTPAQIESTMNLVAKVLGGGAPARAKAFGSFYAGNLSALASAVSAKKSAQPPTVYYGAGPSATTTVGNGNIITSSIKEAGGVNIAAEHGVGANQSGSYAFPTVSTEKLLSWNPGYVVGISPQVASAFTSSPKFAKLTAVRDHHVYACPTGVFDWCASGPETALQPLYLASVIHPGLVPASELAGKVRTFYSEFFGYHPSNSEVTALLAGKA